MPEPLVHVFPKYDRSGASSRHRTHKVFDRLSGTRFRFFPLFDADYIRGLYSGQGRRKGHAAGRYLRRLGDLLARDSRRADLVVVEKEFLPSVPWVVESALWPRGIPVVVDYDDAIYAWYRDRPLLRDKIEKVMAKADIVVCGNQHLAGIARKVQRDVRVVPTAVETNEYRVARWNGERRPLRLGWVGTPSTQRYLIPYLELFGEMAGTSGIKVIAVGARPEGPIVGCKAIECVEWNEDTERDLGSLFDVGIMPLPDHEFERGKCGFKILQYAACGLPAIASPVGANNEIIVDGETGILAGSHAEWAAAIRTIQADRSLLERMGGAARNRVVELYDLRISVGFWQGLISELAGGMPPGRSNGTKFAKSTYER